MMGMGSLSNLVLIGLEWLLRNFNRLGRIANRALYYPLKYACWLQIGAVIMLVGYAIKAYNSGEKP